VISPKYARGARVVVRPPADVPELQELAGVTGLVIDTTHPEHPEATVLSLDASPGSLALVSQEWLAPIDDKPCVTLDLRCCALAPCAGCLIMFQAHLRLSLTAAGLTGDQGMRFVTEWNVQRERGRKQSIDLARQARAYAVAEAEKRSAPPVEASAEEPEAKTAAPPAAEEVGLPPSTSPSDSPQIVPTPSGERVEKKSSTKKKKPAKTAAPSTAADGPPLHEAPPVASEGATGDGEAAG
jgi:hypothetical protein